VADGWATVRAWAGSARAARCRDCRRPIVWVIREDGAYRAFDMGFTVRETVTHPTSRAQFVVLDKSDQHDCKERRKRRANK
jgi:hypothetical protein